MDKFIPKKIYKEKDPKDTINTIKSILNNLDIKLKETTFYHKSSSLTHASELRFNYEGLGKTRIATNGKGMSKEYSLASAYGEMMERLQCGALLSDYSFKAFINKDIDYLFSSDEKEINLYDFVLNDDFLEKLLNCKKELVLNLVKDKKCIGLPFYDVINDKEAYLPYQLIYYLVGCNGMCAGNTAKEAIAQGLNELYERQALCEIYRDNPELKRLDKELYKDTSVYYKLNHLESLGCSYDIVDCSMCKEYPVIGLRLINENGLLFLCGADPSPIVALERCLTEAHQTTTEESIKKRFNKDSCGIRSKLNNFIETGYYHWQLLRSKTFGSGEKPDNVHNLSDCYSDNYIYNNSEINDFDYLVQLTKKLGYSLYVRDCSYLGFPAYITLIPELALADYFTEEEITTYFNKILNEPLYKDKDGYGVILSILKKLESKRLKIAQNSSILSR